MDAETQSLRFVSYLLMWVTAILILVVPGVKNPMISMVVMVVYWFQAAIFYTIGWTFMSGLYLGGSLAWIVIAVCQHKHPD